MFKSKEEYYSTFFGRKFKFQNLNVKNSFSVVCDFGKIAFLGLVCVLQHMWKSLIMMILHILDIHFELNNTFPQHLYPHVALFDPIGSPLGAPSIIFWWAQAQARLA